MAQAYYPAALSKCVHALNITTSIWSSTNCIDNHIDNPSNVMGGCSSMSGDICCKLKGISVYRGYGVGSAYPWQVGAFECIGDGGSHNASSMCPGVYSSTPVYGYVTRTRLTTYDKQSGLFSHGVGVPFAAQNYGLYSTRHV